VTDESQQRPQTPNQSYFTNGMLWGSLIMATHFKAVAFRNSQKTKSEMFVRAT